MAATKNTTPTRAQLLSAAAAVLLLAGAAHSLATFAGEQRRDSARAVVVQTSAKSAVPDSVIDDAAPDNTNQNFAAATAIYNADRAPDFAARMGYLLQARALQESALAAVPADPYGWMRLSYLRLATQNNREAALAALRMSVESGPYEPLLTLPRAKALFKLRDLISPDDMILQTAWRDAWNADWVALMAAVRRDPALVPSVEAAMQGDLPANYAEWQRQLRGSPRK